MNPSQLRAPWSTDKGVLCRLRSGLPLMRRSRELAFAFLRHALSCAVLLIVATVVAGCAAPTVAKETVPFPYSLVGEWIGHWRSKQFNQATGQIRYTIQNVQPRGDGKFLVTGRSFWTTGTGSREDTLGCVLEGYRMLCGTQLWIIEGDVIRGEWSGSHETLTQEMRKR